MVSSRPSLIVRQSIGHQHKIIYVYVSIPENPSRRSFDQSNTILKNSFYKKQGTEVIRYGLVMKIEIVVDQNTQRVHVMYM
jgi:hypothetical protein